MQSMFLKQVKLDKRNEVHMQADQVDDAQGRHFILTRQLGHSLEMPGSQEWQLFRESTSQCYVCDHRIYALFFWSPEIGNLDGFDCGLTPQEQSQIAKIILTKRETNERRQELIQSLDPALTSYQGPYAINPKSECYEEGKTLLCDQTVQKSNKFEIEQFTQVGPALKLKGL